MSRSLRFCTSIAPQSLVKTCGAGTNTLMNTLFTQNIKQWLTSFISTDEIVYGLSSLHCTGHIVNEDRLQ